MSCFYVPLCVQDTAYQLVRQGTELRGISVRNAPAAREACTATGLNACDYPSVICMRTGASDMCWDRLFTLWFRQFLCCCSTSLFSWFALAWLTYRCTLPIYICHASCLHFTCILYVPCASHVHLVCIFRCILHGDHMLFLPRTHRHIWTSAPMS